MSYNEVNIKNWLFRKINKYNDTADIKDIIGVRRAGKSKLLEEFKIYYKKR